MKALFLTLALMSTQAFAATNGYELKMELSLDGKHISSPRILAKEGEAAAIEQKNPTDSSYIEVKTTESIVANQKRIKMSFTVWIVDKNGQKTVTSKSNVIVKENATTKVVLSENEDNTKHLVLSVVAKRKSL